jgi:2,3-bisphosphoglycerate-dependent phosphoglycerate mutase
MPDKTNQLVIIRHSESEWNALGKWTGLSDAQLDQKGYHESILMGQLLKDIQFDYAYCSEQLRALETLEGVLHSSKQPEVHFERSAALNERDYGDYTAKNKWEIKEMLGPPAFDALRRGWNVPIPNGETLKMVYERIVPYYFGTIVPRLNNGEHILIVSHANAIRALVKYIESITDEEIANVEMVFGTALIYETDKSGKKLKKTVRKMS